MSSPDADSLRIFAAGGRIVDAASAYSAQGATARWNGDAFLPGEQVRVSATPQLKGANGEAANPFVWQFRTATSGGTGYFDTGSVFDAPPNEALQFGDFDRDGDLDAVFSGVDTRIYVNDGDGGFTVGQTIEHAQFATAVATGDIDGDGDLDLLVSDVTSAMYNFELRSAADAIYLNDGAGHFTASATAIPNNYTAGSAMGDLDGDGDLDMLTIAMDTGDQRFTIWINNGMAFTERRLSTSGADLELSDLDLDGDLDIVVAGGVHGGFEYATHVWMNDGSANFSYSGESHHLAYAISFGVAVGDLNGDGRPDVAIPDWQGEDNSIWFGDGAGHFTDSGQRLGDIPSTDVQLGDLDGDGDLDVMLFGEKESSVWFNDGDGLFTRSRQTVPGSLVQEGALGDLDGDGDLDSWLIGYPQGRVLLNHPEPADLEVQIDDGNAVVMPSDAVVYTIAVTNHGPSDVVGASVTSKLSAELETIAWTSVGTPGTTSTHAGTGDFVDVVTIPAGGSIVYTMTATVGTDLKLSKPEAWLTSTVQVTAPDGVLEYLSANDGASDINALLIPATTGTGGFRQSGQQMGSAPLGVVELFDIDDDRDVDAFVAGTAGGTELWINDGAGGFASHGNVFDPYITTALAGFDWDNDGDTDIVRSSRTHGMQIWQNEGNLEFVRIEEGEQYFGPGGREIEVFDLDGNGHLDVITTTTSQIYVTLNRGGGALDNAKWYGDDDSDTIASTFGDYDNDGDIDVVMVNYRRTSELWLNDGYGRFSESPDSFYSEFATSADTGDLDGDGDLDLYLGSNATGTGTGAVSANSVWLNDGHGDFTDSGQRLGLSGTNRVRLGDLDGDGDLDAVSAENTYDDPPTMGQLIYLNDGSGNFTRTGSDWGPAASFDIELGDLNADGSLDAFVLNHSATVWLNDALAVDLAVDLHEPNVNVLPGAALTYTLEVENRGPNPAQDASVEVFASPDLADLAWTAVTSGGASAVPAGSGEIREIISLPPGARVVYTISATVAPPGAMLTQSSAQLSARVGAPTDGLDYLPVNNEDTDFDFIQSVPDASSAVFTAGAPLEDAQYEGEWALGDIDGDGDLDAIAGVNEGALVLENDGAGRYTQRATLAAAGTDDVQLADLDGDGDLDLLHVEYTGNLLIYRRTSTWINDGSGNFTDLGGGILERGASEAGLADLDGDGDVDLFLHWRQQSSSYQNWPQVYLNNGDGSFTSNGQFLSIEGRFVRLGDIDSDGDVDAVTDGFFPVWLNDGNGYFFALPDALTLRRETPFDLGDLDGDGDLDVMVAGKDDEPLAEQIFLNDGTGRFNPSDVTLDIRGATNITLGDLDGDGDLDAISTSWNYAGQAVWINHGDATFEVGVHRIGTLRGRGLALGDLDGDRDLDVITSDAYDRAELFLNYNGAFNDLQIEIANATAALAQGEQTTYQVLVQNVGPTPVAGALVNAQFPVELSGVSWTSQVSGGAMAAPSGDGNIADLVTLPAGGTILYTVTATVALPPNANPPGQLIVTASVESTAAVFDPATQSNRHSDNDLIDPRADYGYRNLIPGTQPDATDANLSASLGDWDGDGDLDAILPNGPDPVVMLQNDGMGGFVTAAGNLPSAKWLQLGDLDGDGDLDLLMTRAFSRMEAWLNDGGGTFTLGPQGQQSISANRFLLGDLDGDSDLDVYIFSGASNSTSFLLNDGVGNFVPHLQSEVTGERRDASLADLNGDGLLDLLLLTDRYFQVLVNQGGAWFNYVNNSDLYDAYAVDVGDVDGDGDLDAVFAGTSNSQSVWVNNGQGGFSRQQTLSHPGDGRAVSLGDLDADGDLDAFIATAAGRADQVWHNDGFGYFIRTGQALGAGNGVGVALGDVDNDGDLDVYVAQEGADALWLNYPAPGDTFPFDGVVRLEDLNAVRNHFGSPGPADGTLPGDTFPFDGAVDLRDLNAVRNNFGGSTPLPVTSPGAMGRSAAIQPDLPMRRVQVETASPALERAADALFDQLARQSPTVSPKLRARFLRSWQ